MSLQVMIPPLRALDKSAIFLVSTILFFVLNILDIDDLELIPWNIVLLFAGAMSIGYCLWQTGAAEWLAINWLALFKQAHWLVFVLGVAFFVLVLTNFIMNVAAIAISLPVALVIAKYSVGSPGRGHVRFTRHSRHAVRPVGGSCTECDRLRFQAVHQRRVSHVWDSSESHVDGALALMCYVVWPLMGMPVLVK